MIVIGTADGLYEIGLDGAIQRQALAGTEVLAVSGEWAIADDAVVSISTGRKAPLPDGLQPRCLLSGPGDSCLVGTSSARLFEIDAQGARPIDTFDAIPERPHWSTPWGGPPDTRSMARSARGLLVNVHVGGVWRGDGHTWVEVVPADHDAHQVVADEATVVVAAATGVGQSSDGGSTWSWGADGLHATYCRAATIAAGWLLVSASTGPGTHHGAIYRRPLASPTAPFVPCGGSGALPKAFAHNVDTFEMTAAGELVAVGTPTGEVFVSEDSGATWRRLIEALPGVRSVSFAA